MPSWIGPWEIAIVLVIALLIFGPKKLPDLGSSLGKSIRGFKSGLKDAQDEVTTAFKEDGTAEAPVSAEATMASTTAASTTAATAAPAAEATEPAASAEPAATTETTTEQS